jgi:N-acyl-D-amino-acid deacylase
MSRFIGRAARALLIVFSCLFCFGQEWDLVIRNGQIVDGTGKAGFAGAVAVKDGRIARVGDVPGTGQREIDARGLVVAPGFIDVHTHAEGILGATLAENFLRMGVTSVIVGNCGASEVNVGEFFRMLERTNVSANVGTLIGHNSVRRIGVGDNVSRAPTDAEMARMKEMIAQAMKDGAVGFSTGLIYSPGKFSKTEEIIDLAKVAAEYGGIYATHVRDEQEGLLDSLQEAFRVGREAKIPVEISHLKISGNLISPQKPETIHFLEKARSEGFVDKIIAALDAARRSGVQVTQDLYPYSAASASLTRVLPAAALEGGREQLDRRLRDPVERSAIAEAMKKELIASGHSNYGHVVIITARRFKSLQGLTVPQAAKVRRNSDSLDAQIETILDLAISDVSIILYDFNEADLVPLMKLPNTMFISDTGTFQFGNETEHPRGYGSDARVLARYVRAEKVLSLEEAIRKMTSLCATTFHLKDRGEIRPGAWADIVVFDPATVQDNADYASPHVCATGFKHVFVNGVETVADDRHTGARAGRPLRRGL